MHECQVLDQRRRQVQPERPHRHDPAHQAGGRRRQSCITLDGSCEHLKRQSPVVQRRPQLSLARRDLPPLGVILAPHRLQAGRLSALALFEVSNGASTPLITTGIWEPFQDARPSRR